MSLASAEENKKVARYLIEEIYQNGNLDLIDEVLAEHAVDHEEFRGWPADQRPRGVQHRRPDIQIRIS